MNFLLAFERNKNDFVPIDFTLLSLPNPFGDIKKIDEITSKIELQKFLELIKETNIFSENVINSPLILIYYENGKMRKSKFGPIFKETDILNYQELQTFIINNLQNKNRMNQIWNTFYHEKSTPAFKEFLNGIKNGNFNYLEQCNYIELRNLSLYIGSNYGREN